MNSQMLFGIHTIAWGERVDLDTMLSEIKEAGYQGAELFQHPDVFSGGIDAVVRAFQRHDLTLIGTCAGSFRERIDLVREYSKMHAKPINDPTTPYIYIDEWYPGLAEKALQDGFRLALHPHMYMAVQTLKEADDFLTKHPRLLFLPDTAHLTIAGEDSPRRNDSQLKGDSTALVAAIRTRWSRLAAVHLKDWREEVGRSYQFYGDGFCPFGQGNVRLKEVIELLWRKQYRRWIVVEHDRAENPKELAGDSLKWILPHLPPSYQPKAMGAEHA